MIGPRTSGGFMVAIVKFGFSFSTNSQALFSANVLLPIEWISHVFDISCILDHVTSVAKGLA